MLYNVWGFLIQSNIPLPETSCVEEEKARFSFRLFPATEFKLTPGHWFYNYHLPNGRVWLSLAQYGSGYHLRFPCMADFIISIEAQEIWCYSHSNIPVETIQHLFLDQVIPLLLSHFGEVTLHASAVATVEGGIAFLGKSGLGKSTLAMSFAQKGHPFLTDDCLLLRWRGDDVMAIPSYPSVRLWPDGISAFAKPGSETRPVAHYTRKQWLEAEGGWHRFSTEPIPIRKIYILDLPTEAHSSQSVTISALSARESFIHLVKNTYRLDITDHDRAKDEFIRLGQIVSAVEFSHLAYPRDLSYLSHVRDTILSDLSVL